MPVRRLSSLLCQSFNLLVAMFICCCFSMISSTKVCAWTEMNVGQFNKLAELSHSTVQCVMQDSRGFMWFGTRYGLDRYDGHEFRISHRTGLHGGLRSESIFCMTEDKDGRLWIGTDNGLCIYDPHKDNFTDFNATTEDGLSPVKAVRYLQVTEDGSIWMLAHGCLFRYAPDGVLQHFGKTLPASMDNSRKAIYAIRNTFYLALSDGLYSSSDNGTTFELIVSYDLEPSLIYEYGVGKLLLGTRSEGLYVVDLNTGRMKMVEVEDECTLEAQDFYPNSIVRIDESTFWIGSETGLYLLHDGKLANIPDYLPRQMDVVLDLCKDAHGGIWVANNFNGVTYFPRRRTMFDCYSANDNMLTGNIVRSIIESDANTLFVCTEDGGLCKFDLETKICTQVVASDGTDLSQIDIQCGKWSISGKIILGTYRSGLYVYDPQTNDLQHYMNRTDVFVLNELRDGTMLFSTSNGIYRFDPSSGNNPTLFLDNVQNLTDIQEDRHGILWLLTENGLFRYNPKTSDLRSYFHDASDLTSICGNYLAHSLIDSDGHIWFASEGGGMCCYNESADCFECITVEDGLPSNSVNCMVEDERHCLWAGTSDGLAIVNLANHQVMATYGVENGLPSKHITLKSAVRLSSGMLAFGTFGGLVLADGSRKEVQASSSEICFTALYIHNEEVLPQSDVSRHRGKHPTLTETMPYTKAIRLRHNDDTFTLSFTTFDYAHEDKGIFTYRMQGLDKQWNYTGNDNRISYHNLPPGRYKLCIQPARGAAGGNATVTQLSIRVLPAWWASPGCLVLYIALLAAITYYAVRISRKRLHVREEQAQMQRQREEDARLYQAKIDFFTNIAHEIRTPASLIRDPLHALQKKELPKDVKQTLSLVERSAENLNNLINELLEFRQAESGAGKATPQIEELTGIVRSTWDEFQPFADARGLRMEISLPTSAVRVCIDARAMKKILDNLLSNAVKYASSYIRLNLEVNESMRSAILMQSNDGALVPTDMREKIFEPFVQVRDERLATQGTGLGLALASSLAKMQGCNLCMGDSVTENTFVLEVPLLLQNDVTADIQMHDEDISNDAIKTAEGTTLLVVEDYVDLRVYLSSRLREHYNVIEAADGMEALQLLEKHIIHLVLSDVMMPHKDGLELCHDIKNNIELSHIPVVLLTAKAAVEDHIQGLEDGADAYIGKPFKMEYVEAQIASLLENRRLLREKFAHEPMAEISNIAHVRADERLINEMTECVMQHIDDSEWNIDGLAAAMHMSRSTLSRKIKALTNQNPSEFIRLIRLRHAANLLRSGSYHLNEVSFMVGFNSPHYFSTIFQQQFGVKPSDYAAGLRPKD